MEKTPATRSPALLRRLLLSQAVQRAEAQHQVDGVDPHHHAVLEEFPEYAESHAVVGVVEGRD